MNLLVTFLFSFFSLGYRHQHKKKSYDPIDYDYIDKTDFWVTEEEAGELPHELDFDDIIEQAIYDEDDATPITIGGSTQG